MTKRIIICLVLVAFLALMASPVLAASASESARKTVEGIGAIKTDPLAAYAGTIVKAILGLVGVIFVILIIWGGMIWMLSAGDSSKISKAKSMITWAVLGLIIIFAAYSITIFVLGGFGVENPAPTTQPTDSTQPSDGLQEGVMDDPNRVYPD